LDWRFDGRRSSRTLEQSGRLSHDDAPALPMNFGIHLHQFFHGVHERSIRHPHRPPVGAAGDEQDILPKEAKAFERSTIQVRPASGAAGIVGRALLQKKLGIAEKALPKSVDGVPI
jgi:hypothetical protein